MRPVLKDPARALQLVERVGLGALGGGPPLVPVLVAKLPDQVALLRNQVAALSVGPLVLPEFTVTLLNYIGLYAIVAVGLVLLTGVGGLTSFGQAAFVGLGAYTTAWLTTAYGLSPRNYRRLCRAGLWVTTGVRRESPESDGAKQR
jgi:hypothetical protein